jgi:lysozyme family protein/peptidoglycan hydrolase-like protein with peptidoglycan-binding domain
MRLTGGVTKEYDRLWSSCAIRPRRSGAVDEIVDRIAANKGRYQKAGRPSGVPWYVVGIIHMLESSGNFSTHLHNGDPLSARTVHVPAGRPAKGSPPFTWEESAADALAGQGLGRWRDWSVPGTLYVFERYNGFGYRPRGIPSPYLWSFSNHYSKGKFVADGRFSPSAVSQQCGSGVLLRRLAERGLVKLDGRGMGRRATQRNGRAPDHDGVLRRGSKGAKVTALKKRLRTWLETAAPGEWGRFRVSDNDVFGAPLERAVKAFQERAGLEPDGEVGPLTLAALKQRPRKPTTPKVRELAAHERALMIGSTGKQVRLVQEWLSLQRQQVAVDGEFGPATQKAVKAFQTGHGLRQTGAVDAATWAALTAPMSAALTPVLRRMALGMTVVSYATQHLKQHAREVGGQNRGPWVRVYTDGKEGNPYPWCAGFATFCLKQACDSLGMPMPVQRTLSCDVMASSSGSRFLRGSAAGAHGRIRPGSFFLQQARGGERRLYKYRHTGIVVSAGRDTMATIEGNTNDDGSAEGYEVCARTRGYGNMDFIVL